MLMCMLELWQFDKAEYIGSIIKEREQSRTFIAKTNNKMGENSMFAMELIQFLETPWLFH